MSEHFYKIKAPVAWLPAGLISWYAPGGAPVALVTAWVALVGGDKPSIRTAWHGCTDPSSSFRAGGDFILNVPREHDMPQIRDVMAQGKLCLNPEEALNYSCVPGAVAVAPRLLGCAVQVECLAGRLVETAFDAELCGSVAGVCRNDDFIDSSDIHDLCAIQPLSPQSGL